MSRRSGMLDALVAIVVLAALVAVSAWLRTETVAGAVRVVDGDSLELGTRRIRLKGIDAPELAQSCERAGELYRCGEVARDALRDLVRRGEVSCRLDGSDRYGRSLALCSVGSRDLGAELVRRGLAVAYGLYEAEEAEARLRRLGVWAGTFQMPAAWRKERGRNAGPPSACARAQTGPDGSC